jgi:anti-anti-sigma factor
MSNPIDIIVYENYTVIKILFKEYDIHNTTTLLRSSEDVIATLTTPHVIIDFSQVVYIDSSGIGSIAHIKKILTKNGIDLICVGMIDSVMKVFRITNTEALFKIFNTLDEGIKYIEENS